MTITTQLPVVSKANKSNNMTLLIVVLSLILLLWNTANDDVAVMAATITTDTKLYAIGTPIQFSWNYTSKYTGTGAFSNDMVAIFFNNIKPHPFMYPNIMQMWVYVGTLTQQQSTTIRNDGSITFDGNNPVETESQSWPLQIGQYKAYLFSRGDNVANFTIYAETNTFSVVPPFVTTNKPSYYFNESITLNWVYTSNYTGTGNPNLDWIGIFDASNQNIDLFQNILFVWISSLENGSTANTTIRNTGTVTFDIQPPDETSLQAWPLPVGSYKAILINNAGRNKYVESDTFVVVPATASPTKVPTKAPTTDTPTIAPTSVPSNAPIRSSNKQLFCNVFFLRYIFCSVRCGWIGRLLKTCSRE